MTDKFDSGIEKIAIGLRLSHAIDHNLSVKDGIDHSVDLLKMIDIKAGSLRYTKPTGEVIVVQPGERMYSSASMLATEFYDGKSWKSYGELDD